MRAIRKSVAMTFETIPAWAIDPDRRDRYTVATAFQLAGLTGRRVRLTAETQRAVFGHNLFGKCQVEVTETGISTHRSVCFGTDWSGITLDWARLEQLMATGERPCF